MNVLFLLTDAYGTNGGIAQVNRDLLEVMKSAPGIRQVVVLPRSAGAPSVIHGRLTYRAGAAGSKIRFVAALLAELVKGGRYDLILCGHVHLLPLAGFAARVTGAPLWLIIHGIEAWTPSPHRVANWIAGRVDRCISVSNYSLDRFVAWSGLPLSRTVVVPNAVDLSRYTPGPKRTDLVARYGLNGSRVILTLGRLVSQEREKGFDRVLEVLPALYDDVENVKYVIAGSGPDRPRLERKAAELGVAHSVVFTGYVREEDKVDLYRLSDVFAMPSLGEGFGIALLEALACGSPVIASQSDGSREAVLHGKLGAAVDPENRTELKNTILAALADTSREPPEGLEYFSKAAFRDRWLTILRPLTSSRPDPESVERA